MRYSATEFETLYRRLFPPSMRLALSLLHDEEDARDVVHGVFSKLWESESVIENPSAFILRAIRNASLNRIDKLDRHAKILRQITLEAATEDVDPDLRHEEVLSAIADILTPRERQVVEKVFQEGLTYRKTAIDLEISESAVNKHIVAALKKLRNHFKGK